MPLPALGALGPLAAGAGAAGGGSGVLASLAGVAAALLGGSRTQVTTTQATGVTAAVSPVIAVASGGGTIGSPTAGGSPTGSARAASTAELSDQLRFPFFASPGTYGPTRLPQTNSVESSGAAKAVAKANALGDFIKSPLGLAAIAAVAFMVFGGKK